MECRDGPVGRQYIGKNMSEQININSKQIPKDERLKPDPESQFVIEVPTRLLPHDMVDQIKRALRKAYLQHQAGNTGAVVCFVHRYTPDDGDDECLTFKGQFFNNADALRILDELKR